MKLESESVEILKWALQRMQGGVSHLPDFASGYDAEDVKAVLSEVADRMQENFPYFHPYYAAQMMKPPHTVARLAYMLSLWLNPNNHALDGGRASSLMEKEAVAEIATLFGWRNFLGHLCSGGTMANLEALWVSGKLKPGLKVAASEQAHYTHSRISDVLGLSFQSVPCDTQSRMDVDALAEILQTGDIGTVVATIGTTGTGSIDPLSGILALKKRHDFRLHADAAYGGYFTLTGNLDPGAREAFDRLGAVDSIAIDPHKHGLQPYGCGCILFKDPGVGGFYKHDSPYTYFSSPELHLGEISLECSRPGASAVALWATQRLLPLIPGGEFARGLERSRNAALAFHKRLSNDSRFLTIMKPELDIVVWAPAAERASTISRLTGELFNAAASEDLHFATFKYPARLLEDSWTGVELDQDEVTCLRSCLMKPEHLDWIERIWAKLDAVTNRVLENRKTSRYDG